MFNKHCLSSISGIPNTRLYGIDDIMDLHVLNGLNFLEQQNLDEQTNSNVIQNYTKLYKKCTLPEIK